MKEVTFDFVIDGMTCGSSILLVEDGKLNTAIVEEEFYSVLRKHEKSIIADAEEEERQHIIDHLTNAQEEKLREEHAKDYNGTDDDMTDAYEDWLMELELDGLKQILK